MSHPAELIQRIRALLERDYDPSQFAYDIEKAIPSTRLYPDIVVRRGAQIVCAVEIGYTRPEKLTAYRRKLKIPDVRWYDKQGRLHADVLEKVVKVTAELTLATPQEVRAYLLYGQSPCYSNECLTANCRWCDDCSARWESFNCPDHGGGADDCNCLKSCIQSENVDMCDQCVASLFDGTLTYIITDDVKAFYFSYCTQCESSWRDDGDEVLASCDLADLSAREFGLQYGAATYMSWQSAQAMIREAHDIELRYEDGEFLRPEDQNKLQTRIQLLTEDAR